MKTCFLFLKKATVYDTQSFSKLNIIQLGLCIVLKYNACIKNYLFACQLPDLQARYSLHFYWAEVESIIPCSMCVKTMRVKASVYNVKLTDDITTYPCWGFLGYNFLANWSIISTDTSAIRCLEEPHSFQVTGISRTNYRTSLGVFNTDLRAKCKGKY